MSKLRCARFLNGSNPLPKTAAGNTFRKPTNPQAHRQRSDDVRSALSVRPRLRSTEECKERGRGSWLFDSFNASQRAIQFSPPAFSAFLLLLGSFVLHDMDVLES